MTDILRLMERRRSRRKYLPVPLDPRCARVIQSGIADFNALGESAKMRLVQGDGRALNGLTKSYGMFTGVRNYIALTGSSADTLGLEKLGYFGQSIVLQATAMGLGSCWVGDSVDRTAYPYGTEPGTGVICVIVVGHAAPERSGKEKLIRGIVHRRTKAIERMYDSDGPVPGWFIAGMRAVQRAPSALNRQPVMFTYRDGVVRAAVKDISARFYAIDLGIAKLHFELGAGGGEWAFGNNAEFRRTTGE